MGNVLAGVAIIGLGICILKWPRVVWRLSHGWTLENPEKAELSTDFMAINFLCGISTMLVGFLSILFGLLGHK
jgi:hypothetical protein